MGEAANKPLLAVRNLKVNYGSIAAIRGISFEVFGGEIVSLIGANGAGKTTTLRALSGIVESSGEIIFEGREIGKVPPYERVTFGLAQSPEGRGVFPQMTVHENLEMGAYFRKDRSTITNEMNECFKIFPRLREREKQLAGTLSGGEQQMLAICRAMMSKPKLLLLDEPSLGLAPKIVAQIFEIAKELNRQGVTILLVEQNARMALKISNRAYVLETGEITNTGSGISLLNDDSVRRSYLGG
jgi:branched-chain amino acid transport system ATP-binding protein